MEAIQDKKEQSMDTQKNMDKYQKCQEKLALKK